MLVDTNILSRVLQPHHPAYEIADRAVRLLPSRGFVLHVVPQNLIELWVVASRPIAQNGLGMASADVVVEIARLKTMFRFLPDKPEIYEVWEQLVTTHRVLGKPAHDARLVAAMKVHGLKSILTFDSSGFSRYPGITVVNPADVLP